VLAIRGTKQAVPALAMEGVSALQTRNARRDLFASELGVQPRMMTVQPKGEAFTGPERRGLIQRAAPLATKSRLVGVEGETTPAALAGAKDATLYTLYAAESS
jgi:hypothetical protein